MQTRSPIARRIHRQHLGFCENVAVILGTGDKTFRATIVDKLTLLHYVLEAVVAGIITLVLMAIFLKWVLCQPCLGFNAILEDSGLERRNICKWNRIPDFV